MVEVLRACEREVQFLPLEVREDLADAIARIDDGQMLSFPLSRPMPNIAPGAHELRFRDRSGVYRVIYLIVNFGKIIIVSAFKKTSQQTPRQEIEKAKMRIKGILK